MEEHELLEKMFSTLREPEVRVRLQERQRKLLDDMTTSIGQVAKALRRTVTQLRNWEKQRALIPERAPSKGQEGQRRYDRNDLKKLAVIEELLRRSYSLSDIAAFMAKGYAQLQDDTAPVSGAPAEAAQSLIERINQAEQGYFWRFFVPQVLYLAISLVFEAPPAGDVGLFLPIHAAAQFAAAPKLTHAGEIVRLGRTLLGWQGRDRPFYTAFSEQGIALEYPNLYGLIPLDELTPLSPPTGAYLVADRKIADALKMPDHLALRTTGLALTTAQRLLLLLQESSAEWVPLMRTEASYMVYHAPDLTAPTLLGDPVLKRMAEMVVRAGGMKADGKTPKWRFACILLPDNPAAPVYQWNLVVQAQSAKSPHQIGVTTLKSEPQTPISLSQRALHSGHIVSRSEISSEDMAIASRIVEEPIRSALALPVEGAEGRSLGVLYIVSDEPAAFNEDDQRFLRVLGKMIGEVVLTYHARRLPAEVLRRIIRTPQMMEQTLEDYPSENDFIEQLEQLLARIHAGEKLLEHLSFIAIDIDRHIRVAHTFGDWAARNLIWEVGNELQELFRVHSRKPGDLLLYRVYADRFYILMNNFSLEATRAFAARLKRSLTHPYRIKAAHSSQDERDNKFTLEVTLRLGVTSYDLERLESFLRLSSEPVASTVRAFLTRALDQALLAGKNLGGNVIMTWDPKSNDFIHWPPSETTRYQPLDR